MILLNNFIGFVENKLKIINLEKFVNIWGIVYWGFEENFVGSCYNSDFLFLKLKKVLECRSIIYYIWEFFILVEVY